MKRYEGNPILQPIAENPWESKLVFNAAAILLVKQIHILYRAIGNDGVSRIGYATSSDGYTIMDRSSTPVFEPNSEVEHRGCEDPRLSVFGEKIVMAYTALAEHDHGQLPQISLTSIAVVDFLNKSWDWNERLLPFRGIRNKDAVLFFQEKLTVNTLCFIVLNLISAWLIPTTLDDGMTSNPFSGRELKVGTTGKSVQPDRQSKLMKDG
jgi:predicted GH43/DUF377 family glycosyl hydrolase